MASSNPNTSSELAPLFEPLELGPFALPHRIVMAPLTRSRALQPGNAPYELNARYYGQRASAALLISEATQISQQGQGYAWTPGIHTEDQAEGWRLVTDAIHNAGGRPLLQLWHVGRISHPSLQPGGRKPVAPSAIRPRGKAFVEDAEGQGTLVDFVTPHALTPAEIQEVVRDYGRAAAAALRAGFDGVEVHAANGYLIEQFLCTKTNRRRDAYGGPVERRARFLFEVLEEVIGACPAERVGVRLSPLSTFNDIDDENPEETFGTVAQRLNGLGLAYLHVIRNTVSGDVGVQILGARGDAMLRLMRERWRGRLLLCGDFTPDEAARWLAEGRMDLAVFGRLFLANPDLPDRLRLGEPLNEPHRETFYGGGAQGYTDYPTLAQARGEAPREIVTEVDRAGIKPGTGDPMTETSRKAFVRRFGEEFGRPTAGFDDLLHEGFVLHLEGGDLWPRSAVRAWLDERLAGLGELAPKIEDVLAEGDRVVVRGRLTGNVSAPSGITVFRVRGGAIREAWLPGS